MSTLVKSAVVGGSMLLGSVLLADQALAKFVGCSGVPQPLNFSDPVYSGNGCPRGSVEFLGSPDVENQFSLLFSKLSAQQHYSGFPDLRRSFCNVRMAVDVPPGFQMNFTQVEFRGFADIPRTVTGTQEAIIEFPLISPRRLEYVKIEGPRDPGSYRQTVGVELPSFSRCGGRSTLTIDSSVFLGGSMIPPAQMTLDSIDGAVVYQYGVSCRPCQR